MKSSPRNNGGGDAITVERPDWVLRVPAELQSVPVDSPLEVLGGEEALLRGLNVRCGSRFAHGSLHQVVDPAQQHWLPFDGSAIARSDAGEEAGGDVVVRAGDVAVEFNDFVRHF